LEKGQSTIELEKEKLGEQQNSRLISALESIINSKKND